MNSTDNRFLHLSILILGLFGSSAALADACPISATFEPMAKVVTAEQTSLIQEIAENLRLANDEGFMRFGGIISEEGVIERLCCVGTWHQLDNKAAMYFGNRLERLKFIAPKRDGIPVRVFANFTILAKRSSNIVESTLVLNHLHSKESYGLSYIAPQRVIVEERYPEILRGRYRRQRGLRFVAVDIDSQGFPGSQRIVSEETSSRWLESVAEDLVDYCYVPGFSGGVQVGMTFYEPL